MNILLANGRNGFIDPESSKCPNYLEECCRLPDYFEPVTAPPRPSKLIRYAEETSDDISTEHLKKAFLRLHDPASGHGGEFTHRRKSLFEGLCLFILALSL